MKQSDLTTYVPESVCLGCGKPNDAATSTTGKAKPKAGSVSVCFYCGHIAIFGDGMRLRELTDKEMHAVAGDPRILRIQKARAFIERMRK